jgi:predicted enzyme related to lactoylglutathione lyase
MTLINYIEFGATNMEATQKFYESAFGWTFTHYGPSYMGFKEAGSTEEGGGFTTESKPGANPLVILKSEDLESTKDIIEKAGGKIVKDIYSFPGGRRFHFSDPSGNELAVWSSEPTV